MHFTVMTYLKPGEKLEEKLWPFFEQMEPDMDPEDKYLYWMYQLEDEEVYKDTKEALITELARRGIKQDQIEEDKFAYYNPDSKWDWYEAGGRWKNFLLLKNGQGKADSALIEDIAYDVMCSQHKSKFLGLYEAAMDLFGEHLGDDQTMRELWRNACEENPSVFQSPFMDLTSFRLYSKKEWYQMISYQGVSTYSILDVKGQWFDKDNFDQLVWVKMCYDNLKNAPKGTTVVLVDCHV